MVLSSPCTWHRGTKKPKVVQKTARAVSAGTTTPSTIPKWSLPAGTAKSQVTHIPIRDIRIRDLSLAMAARDPNYIFLINELTLAREAAGLTQVAVAEQLARPQSFVSKYESGERRLDIAEFIEVALAIGVNPSTLIERCIEKFPKSKSVLVAKNKTNHRQN